MVQDPFASDGLQQDSRVLNTDAVDVLGAGFQVLADGPGFEASWRTVSVQ